MRTSTGLLFSYERVEKLRQVAGRELHSNGRSCAVFTFDASCEALENLFAWLSVTFVTRATRRSRLGLGGPRHQPLRNLVACVQYQLNQALHLIFADRGVHTRKLQALLVAYPGVSDHSLSLIEKVLTNRGVDLIGIEFRPGRNIAEYNRAELGFAHQFELRRSAYEVGAVVS